MSCEDELTEALRRAGNGFTADRHALVEAGERRGRRLVARRRSAVIGGSVLALAVIGTAGAWAGGVIGGFGPAAPAAAAPAPLETAVPDAETAPRMPGGGSGAVTGEQLIAVLKALLPGGRLTGTEARGTDEPPMVSGVFDDGGGAAAISVGLYRVDPKGADARGVTTCGDRNLRGYDDCRTEHLADGSRLMLFQGYEYPDRRVDTRVWRAVLVTPRGFQVDVSEWNAPAEKGAATTRAAPPLTTAQLKALATSDRWHPALNDLPEAAPDPSVAGFPDAVDLGGRTAEAVLVRLVEGYRIPFVSRGGQEQYGYVVLDDGKGRSLVQVNVSKGRTDAPATGGGAGTTLPDGTRLKVTQQPAGKGSGVVERSVDTLRPDGVRVVVSAYNAADLSAGPTRTEPVLTVARLREIALGPAWSGTP